MRSRNHSCHGKTISVTCSECVSVALFTRHAKRMRRIVLSNLDRLALPYFCTLSYKFYDFRKKTLLNIKREFRLCLQILFETSLILRSIQ
jgi:hypothetical protein